MSMTERIDHLIAHYPSQGLQGRLTGPERSELATYLREHLDDHPPNRDPATRLADAERRYAIETIADDLDPPTPNLHLIPETENP